MDTSELTELPGTETKGVYLDTHPRSLMLSLHKMKKSELMTDVTLILPDQSVIPCHKVVLMAASPYFDTMFLSELTDCTDQNVQVDFADADTIRTLVEFFYTGVIDVTIDNVKQLIAASEFICCEHLKVHLVEYLDNNVESTNCIEQYRFCKLYNLSMLMVIAFEFILFHFKEFASMSDFETLTEDELLEIVSNDGLNVDNEDIVFDAVIHWVDADPKMRREAFVRIAPFIRFPFCTLAMLTHDIGRNRLMLSSGCTDLVIEALSSPHHHSTHHAIHNARCVPRRAFKGVRKERLIRMIELRSTDKLCCSVTIHDSGQSVLEWESILPDIESRLMDFAVSSTGIFWVDKNRELHFLDVKRKQVISATWDPANQESTIVVIGEKITAFGGYKSGPSRALSKSVESFDTGEANPEWKPEPEMLHALLKPNVVRFANKVYVFGGEDEDGPSRVTQEFDLVRGKWRMRSEMPGPCTMGMAVALNDKIYVVGRIERVCYSYEPQKDVWKLLAQPTTIYDNWRATATTWNGNILLGNREHVEEYDPTEDTWSYQRHVLPKGPPRIYKVVLHTVCF